MYYATAASALSNTPVTERLDNRQIENNTGGFVYPVTDQVRLERFLVLGTDTNAYHVSAQKMTVDNLKDLRRMIDTDGLSVVATIVDFAQNVRAPKQDAQIFLLAACICLGDAKVSEAARFAAPKVCWIHSNFLMLLACIHQFRGHDGNGCYGRGIRGMIKAWYGDKPAPKLAYDLVKYRDRQHGGHTFNARNALRMAHPAYGRDAEDLRRPVFDWTLEHKDVDLSHDEIQIVRLFEEARREGFVPERKRTAYASTLTHEMLPDDWKDDPAVWEALLHGNGGMKLNALTRNLAKMTRVGLLTPRSDATSYVISRLTSTAIRNEAVHPAKFLTALGAYRSGGAGGKGGNAHIPVPQIVDALDQAFYLAFPNIVPAGCRMEIGLDISGSMQSNASAAQGLSCMEAATALALVTVNSEPHLNVYGFSEKYTKLPIQPGQRIADVIAYNQRLGFGWTHAALPMEDALKNQRAVDTFVIITDNEVNQGRHPIQALREYRQKMGIPAKLIIYAMQPIEFSIADPADAGTLDIAGFDAFGPVLLADFARGAPTKASKAVIDEN